MCFGSGCGDSWPLRGARRSCLVNWVPRLRDIGIGCSFRTRKFKPGCNIRPILVSLAELRFGESRPGISSSAVTAGHILRTTSDAPDAGSPSGCDMLGSFKSVCRCFLSTTAKPICSPPCLIHALPALAFVLRLVELSYCPMSTSVACHEESCSFGKKGVLLVLLDFSAVSADPGWTRWNADLPLSDARNLLRWLEARTQLELWVGDSETSESGAFPLLCRRDGKPPAAWAWHLRHGSGQPSRFASASWPMCGRCAARCRRLWQACLQN